MKIRSFKTAAAFRAWLLLHHADASEVWVGFYKKASGRVGMAYPEAVDIALCFGWIDGIRKTVDTLRYTNRFTPRRAGSRWSAINVRRVGELREAGLMAPAGLAAFQAWDGKKAPYSFENRETALSPELRTRFVADRVAWAYFTSRPAGYQRVASFWVMNAQKEETRLRRLDALIADSRAKRSIRPLRRTP